MLLASRMKEGKTLISFVSSFIRKERQCCFRVVVSRSRHLHWRGVAPGHFWGSLSGSAVLARPPLRPPTPSCKEPRELPCWCKTSSLSSSVFLFLCFVVLLCDFHLPLHPCVNHSFSRASLLCRSPFSPASARFSLLRHFSQQETVPQLHPCMKTFSWRYSLI